MFRLNLNSPRTARPRRRHDRAPAALLCLAFAAWSTGSPAAAEWRVAGAQDAGVDIERLALAWPIAATAPGVERLEAAAGVLAGSGDRRAFVSLGPVWRLSANDAALRVEFSLSPTLLGGSTFDSLDLGGNLHFTSALSVGWTPNGQRRSGVTLRLAHVSNGGLHRRNPGLDTIGLAFTFGFDDG